MGVCGGVGVVGGRPSYGEPLVAKSPELGFIPTPPPSKSAALAPLVDLAHLSACLGGRLAGATFLFAVRVLVRESRATSLATLAGARWGLSPGLYR